MSATSHFQEEEVEMYNRRKWGVDSAAKKLLRGREKIGFSPPASELQKKDISPFPLYLTYLLFHFLICMFSRKERETEKITSSPCYEQGATPSLWSLWYDIFLSSMKSTPFLAENFRTTCCLFGSSSNRLDTSPSTSAPKETQDSMLLMRTDTRNSRHL